MAGDEHRGKISVPLTRQNTAGKAHERWTNVRSEFDRLLKKAASKAAGERKPEAYPSGYGENFGEPRTKWEAFFSSRRGGA